MKSIISKISFALFIFTAIGTVYLLTISPVKKGGPCSCPTESYGFGSVIRTMGENKTWDTVNALCSQLGCTPSFIVIPLDLIIPGIIFLILGLILRKRNIILPVSLP